MLKERVDIRMSKDYGDLGKCASVAGRYELVTRVTTLSFKHHQIAAPLEDRLEWLKRAEQGDNGKPWSARQLEAEIHKAKRRHSETALGLPKGVTKKSEQFLLF